MRLGTLVLALVAILTLGVAPVFAADPMFLARFNAAAGELPEGLAVGLPGSAAPSGGLYAGMLATGEIKHVAYDGRVSSFAQLPAPGEGFMTGLEWGEDGLYVGLASFDPDTHGIWWVSSDGSQVMRWIAFETTTLPNALKFWNGYLYVTDSIGGAIWRINSQGQVTQWVQSPLLLGDADISPVPIPIGANGLVIEGGMAYVANSNFGRIVRIPIQSNGTAGPPVVHAQGADLVGADGLAGVPGAAGTTLYVAVNAQDAFARVAPNGAVTTIAQGGVLQTPASIVYSRGTLYLTNMTLFEDEAVRQPGILALLIGAAPAQVPARGKGK